MIDNDLSRVEPENNEVIVIPKKRRLAFLGYNDIEVARAAPSANQHNDMSGSLTVVCGATLTKDLLNVTNTLKVVTMDNHGWSNNVILALG